MDIILHFQEQISIKARLGFILSRKGIFSFWFDLKLL